MSLLGFLVWLVAVILVLWLVFWLLNQSNLPQPVRIAIIVLVCIVLGLWLLNTIGYLGDPLIGPPRRAVTVP